jgi:hypothetical protein
VAETSAASSAARGRISAAAASCTLVAAVVQAPDLPAAAAAGLSWLPSAPSWGLQASALLLPLLPLQEARQALQLPLRPSALLLPLLGHVSPPGALSLLGSMLRLPLMQLLSQLLRRWLLKQPTVLTVDDS